MKTNDEPDLYARLKAWWEGMYTSHPWIMRCAIALIVCALLWILLWFVLFSGMSEAADFLYAKF